MSHYIKLYFQLNSLLKLKIILHLGIVKQYLNTIQFLVYQYTGTVIKQVFHKFACSVELKIAYCFKGFLIILKLSPISARTEMTIINKFQTNSRKN